MASKQFILPDLGEGLTEAEIVNWLVAEGDKVEIDQPIIEVESAKSIVDLPSPFEGTVEKLHFAVGDTIHTGQAIISVTVSDELTDVAPVSGADSVPGTALRGDPAAAALGADSGVLAGYGALSAQGAKSRSGRFGKGASTRTPTPTLETKATRNAVGASPVVSPIVRKLARDNGLVAHELVGSGENGLVLRRDVDLAMKASANAGSRVSSRLDGDVRIPINGLRKVVAERMAASRREVPEATIWLDVDATNLLLAKNELEASTGQRWSSTALVAKFVVEGLKRNPILNSSVDMSAGEIIQHSQINLGIAAQTARGLMVPVIHNAQDMTTTQLRDAFVQIVETSKTGAFANDQLRGGTFTLNNYGGYGTDGSAPIINQPEVGMLGLGRVLDRPWVVDGQIVVRKIMVVSMVFDHRICDGDVPSSFINFVSGCIENPISALAGL